MDHDRDKLTEELTELSQTAPEQVAAQLMPMVYDELRALAERRLNAERPGHTLQPTALVHEVFLKLIDQDRVNWQGRTHFLAVGASAMRRILIDHARGRGRDKRGGQWRRVMLDRAYDLADGDDFDAIALHDVLEKLASLDPIQSQIVELRFFGGLTVEEVSHVLGVSKRKVEADWTHAKAWLRAELAEDHPS